MKFFNINNSPVSEEVIFEGKPKATGVGFVSIGTRIRGLLSNNKLDLTGVNVSDDYDVPPNQEDDSVYTKDVNYDETQDFMDKLDVADKVETVSSKLNQSLEEQVSTLKATSEKNKKSVSSETNLPSMSTAEGGTE